MKTQFKVPENRPFFGKFWPQGVPHQLKYDWNMTLRDILLKSSQKWPNYPAMWFLDGWINYRQFNEYVDRFASSLARMGIKKGDVVALHLPNCPQYVIAYYAVVSLGAIVTGINPTYKPLEILHQLKITQAKTIVVLDVLFTNFVQPLEDRWKFDNIIYTNLLDLATGFSKFKKWMAIASKKVPKSRINHSKGKSFLDCLKEKINIPKVKINASEDTAVLMMTGGTTGVPKAAILTHQNVVANAFQCVLTLKYQKNPNREKLLGEGTGNIGILPLFHSFAMTTVMNSSVLLGAW
ncbi:MAG: AMP-binding protein, partial [Promethearchaeota archaeon]